MIRIKPLTLETVKEAIDLVNSVFLTQEDEPADICFPASLNPRQYRTFLSKIQVLKLRYWVAIDDSRRMDGTIGLYCYKSDKQEAFWLGWFCVRPWVRKKGIGSQLLLFAISEARKQRKKFLRLYTSTDPNELDSHRLYEKYGFQLVREEPLGDTGLKKLYYELRF